MQFRVKKAALATPLLQFGGEAQGVDYAVTNRYLTRNGYPHEYLTTSGGHQWYNWEEYCNLFMQRLWK